MKMYKTVRHGENSLQYTILPQNDEFRMDNKLCSAESNCSSAALTRKPRSKRQRTFFAYLSLIFICTIIVGAIVIPFLVSAECLPNPTQWFLKSKAALIGHNTRLMHANNHNVIDDNRHLVATVTTATPSYSSNAYDERYHENLGKKVQIIKENGVEKIMLRVNKTNQIILNNDANKRENDLNQTSIQNKNKNLLKSNDEAHSSLITNNKIDNTDVRKGQEQQQQQQKLLQYMPFSTTIVNSPHAPGAQQQQQQQQLQQQQQQQQQQSSILAPTISTRIIQVPLLKSTAKKPIIPPVLVKSNSNDEKQQHQQISTEIPSMTFSEDKLKKNDWLQAHWPYIDPSSYVQWMRYKAEDSVLLPAILGCGLIVVILIIGVCLLARNKRTLASLVKKRNRHDIEETGTEDNATLLTSNNLSDED